DAGGITTRGSMRRVQVTRKSGVTEVDLLSFELGGDLTQNPSAEEGMRIHVPSRGPSVTLTGAVRRPGEYEIGPTGSLRALLELAQGDRVRDLVLRAGGTAAYADLRLALVERGAVLGPRQRIPVDLQRLIVEKDEAQDILLQNGDVLTLPIVEDKVYVIGEVK